MVILLWFLVGLCQCNIAANFICCSRNLCFCWADWLAMLPCYILLISHQSRSNKSAGVSPWWPLSLVADNPLVWWDHLCWCPHQTVSPPHPALDLTNNVTRSKCEATPAPLWTAETTGDYNQQILRTIRPLPAGRNSDNIEIDKLLQSFISSSE